MNTNNELIDGFFYWVKFSQYAEWETAKFDQELNRFKFTNGSRCEPCYCFKYMKIDFPA